MKTHHSHTWKITSILILLAVLTIVLLPKNKEYSLLFLGLAGGHFLIALIAGFIAWLLFPQRYISKFFKKPKDESFDFGWLPKWLYSYAFASIIMLSLAFYLFFVLEKNTMIQLLAFSVLFLFAINLMIGFLILRGTKRKAQITLPLVDLLPNKKGKILDAGCGAGRTTIALANSLSEAEIVCFDKFDASYIEEGGMHLLKKNLKLAGIEKRVQIESGDITKTDFQQNTFDALVSSYMFDHLGPYKKQALHESFRILKPGGKMLLVIAIRNFSTFGIANVLCFLLPTRKTWINWIENSGFKMISDGKINEGAYFCFEKPKE